MKKKWFKSIFIFFISNLLLVNCYALSFTSQVAGDLDEPPSNESKDKIIEGGIFTSSSSEWPIKIRKLELLAGYARYELDVINNFGNHLFSKSAKARDWRGKVYLKFFFNWLDFTYYYWKENLTFPQTSIFTVTEGDTFEHRDERYGVNFRLSHINFEFGFGKNRQQSFLETDTSRYYTFQMNDNYYYAQFSTFIPTKFYSNLWISALMKKYHETEHELYYMDRGVSREWSAGLLFGSFIQFGPYATYGYENFKYTHKFFGLLNEMSTKFHYRHYGIYFSINL